VPVLDHFLRKFDYPRQQRLVVTQHGALASNEESRSKHAVRVGERPPDVFHRVPVVGRMPIFVLKT
jgi:hypothetical protein